MLVCFCKAPEKQHSLLASGACDYTHANVYHSRWHFLILKLKPSTYREHVMYWGNVIIIHSTRSMFMLAFFFFFYSCIRAWTCIIQDSNFIQRAGKAVNIR